MFGIFIFMTKWNFMLSWVEHEKTFISSGPVCIVALWSPALRLPTLLSVLFSCDMFSRSNANIVSDMVITSFSKMLYFLLGLFVGYFG